MAKRKQTTPRKCSILIHMYREGHTERHIASVLKLSKTAVHKSIVRYRETGSGESQKRKGRPRITDKRHDSHMKRLVLANPTLSSEMIKQELNSIASSRTIRRRLVDDFNLRSRRPAKKPLLNKAQIKKRLAFCQKYRQWTGQHWSKVLFSDESTFCQFESNTTHVRRLPNTRYLPQNTIATVKNSPKIMVWGTFGASGRGCLTLVQPGTTVNSHIYLGFLQDKLRRTMAALRCTTFQQDSAPCHTAGVVKNWFKREKISLLDWPGNSPDLNPI